MYDLQVDRRNAICNVTQNLHAGKYPRWPEESTENPNGLPYDHTTANTFPMLSTFDRFVNIRTPGCHCSSGIAAYVHESTASTASTKRECIPSMPDMNIETESRNYNTLETPLLRRSDVSRIKLARECDDCRSIPKVVSAGETLGGPSGRYQLMHNGVKVIEDGYCGRWMTELIRILKGHHEPQEEKAFHEVLKHLPAEATMVELGSYWAFYSLWFAQAVSKPTVHMIEPDPNHFDVGRRNFELNDTSGSFHRYSLGHCSSPPTEFRCESDGVQRLVPSVSIDDFMELAGLERIDLLLSDIQGAELSMLEGAAKSIEARRLRFLFVSTHHTEISGDPNMHSKCLDFLTTRNAHILVEHTIEESFSGDGLIVASCWEADRSLPRIEISRCDPDKGLFAQSDRRSRTLLGVLKRYHRKCRTELSQLLKVVFRARRDAA